MDQVNRNQVKYPRKERKHDRVADQPARASLRVAQGQEADHPDEVEVDPVYPGSLQADLDEGDLEEVSLEEVSPEEVSP